MHHVNNLPSRWVGGALVKKKKKMSKNIGCNILVVG